MKMIILLVVLSVSSFLIGRYSKRPPVYRADKRKLKLELYINGVKEEEEFWSERMKVDSTMTCKFNKLSDIRLTFMGIESKVSK